MVRRRPPVNLLDTNIFVWSIHEPSRLSPAARRVVEDDSYFISCASLWELISKKGRKTALVDDPVAWWKKYTGRLGRDRILSIHPDHVQHLDVLPGPLADPFDRILMAQCLINGLRLVTIDRVIRDYYQGHVSCVW